jgi:hypothetical protein
MSRNSIVIASRFCGPPNSGNGGYTAGMLARQLGGRVEVTLRAPAPLDVPLEVRPGEDGGLQLLNGELLIAAARPAAGDSKPIPFVSGDVAAAAAGRTFAPAGHPVPGCFVCGPGRQHGDGLRLHVGPVAADDPAWHGVLASPFVPAADLAGEDGQVQPQFVWAALDCPTAYACASAKGMPAILLGRQTVEILRSPAVGESCVVVTAERGQDGRKHYADACLYSSDGELLATCAAVWIAVSTEVLNRGAADA